MFERGYGANFVYIRSDSADFNKKVVIYLRPYDVYYKVKVFTSYQTLCFQSDQFKIASSTYEILSCQARFSKLHNSAHVYQKIIDGNCSTFDSGNYTRVLCSFVTLDNLDHDVNLTMSTNLLSLLGKLSIIKTQQGPRREVLMFCSRKAMITKLSCQLTQYLTI